MCVQATESGDPGLECCGQSRTAVDTQVCIALALSSSQANTHITHLRAAVGHVYNLASCKDNTTVEKCTEVANKQSSIPFHGNVYILFMLTITCYRYKNTIAKPTTKKDSTLRTIIYAYI
jgi:hypothetical protein